MGLRDLPVGVFRDYHRRVYSRSDKVSRMKTAERLKGIRSDLR